MRAVVQRVEKAHVEVNNKTVGKIDNGLLLLVGFTHTDTEKEINWMVNKIINLRIFDDENGIMNKSLLDTNGKILSVSQFTLYGDATKGNRPSYIKAMDQKEATKLYELFNQKLEEQNIKVETGIFREDMKVNLINDGPVTIILEK